MASRSAQTALSPGRLLIYANPINGLPELAVVLGDTPPECATPQVARSAGRARAGTGTGSGAWALLALHSNKLARMQADYSNRGWCAAVQLCAVLCALLPACAKLEA